MSCRSFVKPSVQSGSPQVYRETQRLIGIVGGRVLISGAAFGNRLRDVCRPDGNVTSVVSTAPLGEDESEMKLLSGEAEVDPWDFRDSS